MVNPFEYKTFSTIRKTGIAMLISETVSINASSDMINWLLIIGKSRDIDLEELLSYALSPVPMSLGTTDGTHYQIAIHRRALERFIVTPSAVGHGWQLEDGQLVYMWLEHSPAPQSVLKSINCKCKKSDFKGTCSCIKGGLPCTDYCQCVRELCSNRPSHEVVGSASDYDTDSDVSDVY